MSAAAAAASSGQNPSITRRPRRPICIKPIKSHLFSNLPPPPPPPPSLLSQSSHHPLSLRWTTPPWSRWRAKLFVSGGDGLDGSLRSDPPGDLSFDAFLSVAEMLCIAPPAIYSIGFLVGSVLPGGSKVFQVHLGSRVFVLQFFLLASAVAIGGLIRRRQWRRIFRENASGSSVDLIARINRVEEDLRSSATIIRVLSRQLEKLGIRFRVTRKALKEPIAETAALAQRNSEVTRALAMKEDILEKELGEIQKVLLAMQEQQQKQLELILAIGKAGKLLETKQGAATGQVPTGTNNVIIDKDEVKPLEIQTGRHKGASNDRA